MLLQADAKSLHFWPHLVFVLFIWRSEVHVCCPCSLESCIRGFSDNIETPALIQSLCMLRILHPLTAIIMIHLQTNSYDRLSWHVQTLYTPPIWHQGGRWSVQSLNGSHIWQSKQAWHDGTTV